MRMRIGNALIEAGAILAPMEDVTDQPFRRLCKRMGASLLYTEFAAAEAISRGVDAALQKLQFGEDERPFAIQIYGNRVEAMTRAAEKAAELQPDILDINFGCPSKRVAYGGETSCAGSGLLRFPERMEAITAAVVQAMKPRGIPVTVKTRIGWDSDSINALETVERMERAGAQAIAFHGRTRAQMFKGGADWSWIRAAKEAAGVPVIGNGDVASPTDAVRMLNETGVDAVMIGRGAIGNPWIFAQTKALLETGEAPPMPTAEERAALYLEHLGVVAESKGERGVRRLRRHVKRYLSGFPNAAELRARIMQTTDANEIRGIVCGQFPSAERFIHKRE